jgi:hypothetical protein
VILNSEMRKDVKRLMAAAGIFYGIPAVILIVGAIIKAMDTREIGTCYGCYDPRESFPLLSMTSIEYAGWASLVIAIGLTFAAARLYKADSN